MKRLQSTSTYNFSSENYTYFTWCEGIQDPDNLLCVNNITNFERYALNVLREDHWNICSCAGSDIRYASLAEFMRRGRKKAFVPFY